MSKRNHGDKIKAAILDAGMRVWPDVSARRIGRELGLTHSAVLYHFDDSASLKEAIAVHAVEQKNSAIIVELIAQKHSSVVGLSDADRQRHMRAVG